MVGNGPSGAYINKCYNGVSGASSPNTNRGISITSVASGWIRVTLPFDVTNRLYSVAAEFNSAGSFASGGYKIGANYRRFLRRKVDVHLHQRRHQQHHQRDFHADGVLKMETSARWRDKIGRRCRNAAIVALACVCAANPPMSQAAPLMSGGPYAIVSDVAPCRVGTDGLRQLPHRRDCWGSSNHWSRCCRRLPRFRRVLARRAIHPGACWISTATVWSNQP